ncbi:MAG TPA: glycogen debranching enzyme N-terminal domain-containing protein, partial [Thermoanaerobaculia bacterium]
MSTAKTPVRARRHLEWSAAELSSRERRLSLEWLEADGLGGFACGTVAGARTRRYHGWYIPSIPPPRRRWMLVSGCEEFVLQGDKESALSTQIYQNAVYPEGDANLARFMLEPFPTWVYQAEGWEISRTLCLVRDRSVAIVRYVNRGTTEVGLRLRPLLRFRGAGELLHETPDQDPTTEIRGELTWVRPVPYLPRLYLRAVGVTAEAAPVWYRDFFYPLEAERGYEAAEDLWSPLVWTGRLAPGGEAYLLFSLEEVAADPGHLIEAERRRRDAFARTGDPVLDEMSSRAEVFLVEGDYRDGTILAGFPWFADWGRDSMIAAPGLAQATGRFGAVSRVLNTYGALRRDGLIPNNF